MIDINEYSDETPICPYCEMSLSSLSARRIKSALGIRFLYYCPGCKKVLGISHRKGFWMG